jgi:hypothetical protein
MNTRAILFIVTAIRPLPKDWDIELTQELPRMTGVILPLAEWSQEPKWIPSNSGTHTDTIEAMLNKRTPTSRQKDLRMVEKSVFCKSVSPLENHIQPWTQAPYHCPRAYGQKDRSMNIKKKHSASSDMWDSWVKKVPSFCTAR